MVINAANINGGQSNDWLLPATDSFFFDGGQTFLAPFQNGTTALAGAAAGLAGLPTPDVGFGFGMETSPFAFTAFDPFGLSAWQNLVNQNTNSMLVVQQAALGMNDPITAMALTGTGPFVGATDWFGWDAVTPDPFQAVAGTGGFDAGLFFPSAY